MTIRDRIKNMFWGKVTAPDTQTLKTKGVSITRPTDAIINADMKEYKAAVNAARSRNFQDRWKLYQLYRNTLDFDAHVRALIELRIINTVGKSLQYTVNNRVIDISRLTDSPKWEQFLKDLMMVRFFGIGVFELYFNVWRGLRLFDYQQIPLENIDPYKKIIYQGDYKTGEQIPINGNIIMVGEPNDLGLLLPITRLAILRRANISCFSNYNELAGDNFMLVRYNEPEDPFERQRLREQLQNRERNSIIDLASDVEVTSQTVGGGSVYQTFVALDGICKDELTKIVLGQTMTTEPGSSYAQASVHERTQQSIFDADSKYLLNLLNYEFYDFLRIYGLPEGGAFRFVESTATKITYELEKDLKLKELGILYTDGEIRKKYGIETAGNKLV